MVKLLSISLILLAIIAITYGRSTEYKIDDLELNNKAKTYEREDEAGFEASLHLNIGVNANSEDDNTGEGNTGEGNTGEDNTGEGNTGKGNTGEGNTGEDNTGKGNTGEGNTGEENTGEGNTGEDNTGEGNTGEGNTGEGNTDGVENLQDIIKNLKEEFEATKSELESARDIIKNLKEEFKTTKSELESAIEASKSELESAIETSNDEIAKNTASIQTSNGIMNNLKEEFNATKSELESAIETSNDDIAKNTASIKTSKDVIKNLKEEFESELESAIEASKSELESAINATKSELESAIETSNDEIAKNTASIQTSNEKLRPQSCSQIKDLNPEATTGIYVVYDNIFAVGKEVDCDMSDEGVEMLSKNCKEILDNDPSSNDGVYTININPSTTIDVYCDMSSGGVEVFKNCQEILSSDPTSSDGVYTISVNPSTTIDVYCEMNEGGWTVFQKRFDGSEDFRRNFKEYSEGFGDPSQEHWLGLNNIHQLTSQPGYNSWILRVDLESFEGETAYAQYEEFSVGAGTDYTLSIGSYSGTAGDSMTDLNGARFSTYDRDQDGWSGNCADIRNGAWWFRGCGHSNLNAHTYNDNRSGKGMFWIHWKNSSTMTMKSTVMKMKPIM